MNKKKESKYGFTRGQKADPFDPKPDSFNVNHSVRVHYDP